MTFTRVFTQLIREKDNAWVSDSKQHKNSITIVKKAQNPSSKMFFLQAKDKYPSWKKEGLTH